LTGRVRALVDGARLAGSAAALMNARHLVTSIGGLCAATQQLENLLQ
jgi:hypothetical protein